MWISDIESNVFSRIKTEGTIALRKKYPNIFFTAEEESDDNPVFPTVYVQELSGLEQGRDIESSEINAVLSSFQVDVSDNKEKANAKAVMSQVIKTMKAMRFEVIGTPTYRKINGVYIGTARFRRTIGKNDIL